MGAEVSQQMPVGAKQDLSGNYIHDERKRSISGSEDEHIGIGQRLKLADLERAGIKLNNDLIPPSKNQLNSMHFSDYSLYPDKFLQADGSKPGRRGSLSSDPSSSMTSSPSLPANVPISKYNFRIRSASGSESMKEVSPLRESKGTAGVEGAKAASFTGSKLYYFDFSMIPDKDPNFTLDKQRTTSDVDKPRTTNDNSRRRRLYSLGDLDTTKRENGGNQRVPSPPIIIKVSDQDTIKEEDERPKPPNGSSIPPRKRKTSAPTRFCFFDYSMIPDKDPRWNPKSNDDTKKV